MHSNENGYTLMEMIIVIAIIGVAISLTSFGIGTIYSSNVKNYSSRLMSQIREVQIKELASKDNDFILTISKNQGQYEALTIIRSDFDGDGSIDTREIDLIRFPSNLVIEKYDGYNYIEIVNLSADESAIYFDATSGAVISEGYGKYQLRLIDSNNVQKFELIKENGRVVDDE